LKRLLIKISIIILMLFLQSCDAPRTNPVDPKNPDNTIIKLEGVVKTVGFPNIPIEGVTVYWKPDKLFTNTGADGRFSFANVNRNDGWLYFENENFNRDSSYISWGTQRKIDHEKFLNAVPQLDSLEFYSIVENRFQTTQKYQVVIRARVTDYDGVNDIDTVFIENPAFDLLRKLNFNVVSGFYERTLSPLDFGLTSIDPLIGKDFNIKVKDLAGRIFSIGQANIKRVINEEVQTEYPKNNQSVGIPFDLRWKRFLPGFDFHHKLQIYTDEINPELVWEVDNVSADEFSYEVIASLQGRSFFWVIWAIDEFNNRSRSKPATFIVE
jgi:hypothetical protein